MAGSREFPERPVVGVGGVVIENGRVLLIRRGSEPLKGQWSIPGGTLELGETLAHGVAREMREETGLEVRVGELIEAFERVFPATESGSGEAKPAPENESGVANARPQYHFVILDYLCERIGGELRAGSDVTEVAFAPEDDLERYALTETATRIVRKAFAMTRESGHPQDAAGNTPAKESI